MMNRKQLLQNLEGNLQWDIIIIGGGATGLGAAVDAGSRGYKTLLLERDDFAKGTSSRSTKLIHGGVRYLAQGNFKLVMEALKERGMLLQNAPHVSANLSFIIPVFKYWELFYYGIGLKLYDFMAGKLGLGKTRIISKKNACVLLPTINQKKIKGAIAYQDGQFDDSRLAINLAQTAADHNATVLNYCKVTSLIKEDNKITGVVFTDTINHQEYTMQAKVVINATGVFADSIIKMDEPRKAAMVSPSQGVHIVLDKKFFPGTDAMMIPKTTDGRVLFAVPWHNKVIIGTTDTALKKIKSEPTAHKDEINFILNNLSEYLQVEIKKSDILSVYAGLRPLVKMSSVNKTSLMPRDHTIIVSKTGLVSITGGKWTTYRKMAKDVINKASKAASLPFKKCITASLPIHGWVNNPDKTDPLYFYGADLIELNKLQLENTTWEETIHPSFPYSKACVIWAVRNEMAQTVEDVLARRTRILFLDARAAIESALVVARLMAAEMNNNETWVTEQTNSFITLANNYLP